MAQQNQSSAAPLFLGGAALLWFGDVQQGESLQTYFPQTLCVGLTPL